MPLWVGIREVPTTDGDRCSVFNPAVWWKAEDLMKDPRFRVTDSSFWYSIGCLSTDELRTLQKQFRRVASITEHWTRDSDRLDVLLADPDKSGRWWVVTVYEWESGVE